MDKNNLKKMIRESYLEEQKAKVLLEREEQLYKELLEEGLFSTLSTFVSSMAKKGGEAAYDEISGKMSQLGTSISKKGEELYATISKEWDEAKKREAERIFKETSSELGEAFQRILKSSIEKGRKAGFSDIELISAFQSVVMKSLNASRQEAKKIKTPNAPAPVTPE